MDTGFIGLGVMGQPMALNLLKSGVSLTVWNRSPERCAPLADAGASIAESSAAVFRKCSTVILMLANGEAIDAVLGRGTPDFSSRVQNHLIVHMGTTSPDYSRALASDVQKAGGNYVEAPVSGSRVPAENAQLVGMLAGEPDAIRLAQPLVEAMCSQVFPCGPVPSALQMKLSVNVFLITQVTGLTEAFHFADHHHLNLDQFMAILNAGPMASLVSRMKLPKLVQQDFTPQASIVNVLDNCRLIVEAAAVNQVATPLMSLCEELFRETLNQNHSEKDMVAVIRAMERRTSALSRTPVRQTSSTPLP